MNLARRVADLLTDASYAGGWAFVRALPEPVAQAVFRAGADLAAARARGYAIDDEEHAVGLRCIAAVIFNEVADPVAAVSLSGPMARIPDPRIPVLGDLVRRKADAITAQLGGTLPGWRVEG